jgi:hypothetical protein
MVKDFKDLRSRIGELNSSEKLAKIIYEKIL